MFKPTNKLQAVILFLIILFVQTVQVKWGLRDELDVTFPSVVTTKDPEETQTHDWDYILTRKTTTTTVEYNNSELPNLAISFGGTGSDVVKGSALFPNGNLALCGNASSVNSDILSASAKKTDASGNTAVAGWAKPYGFVVCYSAKGVMQWSREIGGNGLTVVTDCAVLTDGSLVAVGYSTATNLIDASAQAGTKVNAFIYRYESDGTLRSARIMQGDGHNYFYCVTPLPEGGYALGGSSASSTGDYSFKAEQAGAVVMAFNGNDTLAWAHAYTGTTGGCFYGVDSDSDGCLYAVLVSNCANGDFAQFNGFGMGQNDSLVLKYNTDGSLLWYYAVAGSGNDIFKCVTDNGTGGCVVAGYYQTNHNSGVMDGAFAPYRNYGGIDGFLFFLDETGEVTRAREFAGVEDDYITDVYRIGTDYAVAGYTKSANRTFSPIANLGGFDAYVAQMNRTGELVALYSASGSDADVLQTVTGSESAGIYGAGTTSSLDQFFVLTKPAVTSADTSFFVRYALKEE